MGFRYDTRNLTGQQRAIINERDKNNEIIRKEAEKRRKEKEKGKSKDVSEQDENQS